MSNTPSDEELTACYREANGEMHGKAQPLTTQRIFRAMRAAIVKWGTPQPVAREPLTPEQISAMSRKHPAEDLCGWSYRMGIADAEAHHGITQKGGSNADT